MSFSETTLSEAIQNARPGERLEFKDVSTEQMEEAVRKFSQSNKTSQTDTQGARIDLGPHVKEKTYFWGIRVEVDHVGMQALKTGGTAAALTAVGVNPFAAAIIAGVIAIWSAFDRGNGVNFYVTWPGAHWFTSR